MIAAVAAGLSSAGRWLRRLPQGRRGRQVRAAAGSGGRRVRPIDLVVWTTRRLARRTPLSFDHVHGVDTQQSLDKTALDIDPDRSPGIEGYEPATIKHLRLMVEQIPQPLEDWSLVDIGSGKGRVVLFAMALPFRRVVGIELFARLHAIALANLERYRGPRRAGAVDLVCSDAAQAPLPEGDTVVFIYNALRGTLLERLLDHLERTAASSAARRLLIYSNPVERHRIDNRPAFRHLCDGASGLDLVWWGNRRLAVYAFGVWPESVGSAARRRRRQA